jgi:hypothetical protein
MDNSGNFYYYSRVKDIIIRFGEGNGIFNFEKISNHFFSSNSNFLNK